MVTASLWRGYPASSSVSCGGANVTFKKAAKVDEVHEQLEIG